MAASAPVLIPDATFDALVDALASLDVDPAHPEPLRDRIIWALTLGAAIFPETADDETVAV